MSDIQEPEVVRRHFSASLLMHGIPRAYAMLLFSGSERLGWLLLGCSFIGCKFAVYGLAAVVFTIAFGSVLGFEGNQFESGFALLNPLLSGLYVGWLTTCHDLHPAAIGVIWIASVLGTFVATVGLNSLSLRVLGFSAHSIPSVLVTDAVGLACRSVFGPALPYSTNISGLFDFPFIASNSNLLNSVLKGFGAILYSENPLVGAMALMSVLSVSPLSALICVTSYLIGAGALFFFGLPLQSADIFGGFNFVLIGVSLGAAYFVPSTASLLLAWMGAVLTGVLGLALLELMRPFGISPGALPYNLILASVLCALARRSEARGLIPSPCPGVITDSMAHQSLLGRKRFPHLCTPALSLPFTGVRIVTQGFEGDITHRGAWRHAIDFEIETPDLSRPCHSSLEAYQIIGTPVVAPISGWVTYVEAQVHDNAPGQNNAEQNWGNVVVLQSNFGFYAVLAHLQKESVSVKVGEYVLVGQTVGLCGSSGRSPLPHLHVHTQLGAHLGLPTIPFCFKNYLQMTAGGRWFFNTSGVPSANTTVASPIQDDALRDAFYGILPGVYRYRIKTGKDWELYEEIQIDFDTQGRYRVASLNKNARFYGFLSDRVFYSTEFEGNGKSIVALLYIGLARVPCIEAKNTVWVDFVSALPFQIPPVRWFNKMLEPFIGLIFKCYEFQVTTVRDGFIVQAKRQKSGGFSNAPYEVISALQPHKGIVRLEAHFRHSSVLQAELEHYTPFRK